MSQRTVFLSRLIGFYCILAGLAMAAHKQETVGMVTSLLHNPAALFYAALLTVLAGLAMVLGHNIWSGGALPILVTVMGWITFLKGLTLLFLAPEAASALYLGTLQYERFFYYYTAVPFALGACLILLGTERKGASN